MKDIYEKVKKFFKDLNIELKEKFVKFGEYVKEQYHKALDQTKSKVDNVKNIAHKVLVFCIVNYPEAENASG